MTAPDQALQDRIAAADRALAARDLVQARAILEAGVASDPQVAAFWQRLATVRHLGNAPGQALAALDRALEFDPLDFVNLLMRARILEQLQHPGAGEAYGNALAQRRPDPMPPSLVPAIERAQAAWAEHQRTLEHRVAAALEANAVDLTPAERSRVDRLASNVSRRTRIYHSEASHFHYPGLREREFHDRANFPWLEQAEALTGTITQELEAVASAPEAELVPYVQYASSEPLAQWRALNHNRDWTAIHLLQRGATIAPNAALCPQTMAFLGQMDQPWIPGCGANAMFSMLAPQTAIPPHSGVANFRLLCHLPLIIPGKCWFRVGEQVRDWQLGQAWVFDDSIEHEAVNETDQLRAIMIFDIWHPDLSPAERDAIAIAVEASSLAVGAL